MTEWADDVVLWDDDTPMVACLICGEIPETRENACIVTVTDSPGDWLAEWNCHKVCVLNVSAERFRANLKRDFA